MLNIEKHFLLYFITLGNSGDVLSKIIYPNSKYMRTIKWIKNNHT